MFSVANFTIQYSVDHVLVVLEFLSTDVPGLSRRFRPNFQRLPCSKADIEALPRSAHVAILVPVHVFSNLIMDDKLPIRIHKRLCKAQHRRSVVGPCPRLQAEVRIEAIRGHRSKGASAVEFDGAAKSVDDSGSVERAPNA